MEHTAPSDVAGYRLTNKTLCFRSMYNSVTKHRNNCKYRQDHKTTTVNGKGLEALGIKWSDVVTRTRKRNGNILQNATHKIPVINNMQVSAVQSLPS
jgi:hypothetical protein